MSQDTIESLRARVAELERTNSAYKNLTAAQEKQLSAIRQRLYELRGADKTLDSERESNAQLTEQLAAQALTIKTMREAFLRINENIKSANYAGCSDVYHVTNNAILAEALSLPDNSTAVLQEWLDKQFGEPVASTNKEQLGYVQSGKYGSIPMAMWGKDFAAIQLFRKLEIK